MLEILPPGLADAINFVLDHWAEGVLLAGQVIAGLVSALTFLDLLTAAAMKLAVLTASQKDDEFLTKIQKALAGAKTALFWVSVFTASNGNRIGGAIQKILRPLPPAGGPKQ
jgi:hypothetical protein